MNDADFLEALSARTLPPSEFGHAGHVRLGYLLLRQHDFTTALEHTRRLIQAYAASLGKPGRYCETLTVAYLALIQEALHASGDAGAWPAFIERNPQLLSRDLLQKFHSKAA